MSNYLFLRGNRNKNFFMNIATALEDRGHTCHLLKFELGELIFKNEVSTLFVPFHVTRKEYPISNEELCSLSIYNITYRRDILGKDVSDKELKMYKRYMYFIDQFIKSNDIDVICLFNGYHWIDQVAKVIANKRGIEIIYFEDGLFRPYTVTCDHKGINQESSIPRTPDFFDELQVDRNRMKSYLFQPEIEQLKEKNESLLIVAFVKFLSMLGGLFRIHPNYYVHITFWQGLKYFIQKKLFSKRKPDQIDLPKEYVLVPFQVSRDTQILYHSPYIKDMRDLLDLVYESVAHINKEQKRNIQILVKEHPEDMSRNNYQDLKKRYSNVQGVKFIKKYGISRLLNHATAIITINSTVGIEALARNKKVITLGEAFYNIDGVVNHCSSPEKLPQVLKNSLRKSINKDRIEKFIYYLRFIYQIEGSIQSRGRLTAEKIADRIDTNKQRRERKI
ncbi:hypothetical protein ABEW00_06280 [Rossellomorea vietnamensis]|uniref:capsular polysaccharide export protein, LipB/KpsS family n=1 Tax=Rossellomorea vietnamensis TaxID=218284 RepID=UPI003D2B4670